MMSLRLTLPEGKVVEGKDRHSLRQALFLLNAQLAERGMTLLAAGLDPEFFESGLSFNSGYGYLPQHGEAAYMMDSPPHRDKAEAELRRR